MGEINVLVIGSGGREHALCYALKKSPQLGKLFCAPGNGGIADIATCVPIKGDRYILEFCKNENIGLVVVGPEQPLVEGLVDFLSKEGVPVFGPSAKAAQLEGSKGFTKELCRKYNIPTAAYSRFDDETSARAYINTHGAPIVVKADGLAAGKGVTVAMTRPEALAAIKDIFSGKFGAAGASVVIEDYLEGEEVSFFALCDGETAIPFSFAQDHKRVGDGDTGPNTGGMGTYSPAPVFTPALQQETMEKIILPTVRAMKAEGMPYKGVLFAGLMLTKKGPQLIEYNVRFGDPETQVMMMRLTSDLIAALLACVEGGLDKIKLTFDERAALCVVMAAQGYPGDYVKNTVIKGLELTEPLTHVMVFHAGTARQGNDMVATGGRVLGITALGDNVAQAQKHAYEAVHLIEWPEGFFRRDIGWRALAS